MSDDTGLKTDHDSNIFKMVKRKISVLSPSAHHNSAINQQTDLPADYEASIRDVVGKIEQLPDSECNDDLKCSSYSAGSIYTRNTGISAPYVKRNR